MIRTARFLSLLALLLALPLAARAVAVATFSNGATVDVPMEPYFLDPGDDVVDFYSYGSPHASSANTGFEQLNTALVYLTLDDAGQYGLVAVMDKWGGGGGQAELTVSGFPAGSTRAVSDDGGEAGQVTAGGTSFCNWSWSDCCTDGVAYAMSEDLDFTLSLDFNFQVSIDTLRIISFDPCNQGELQFFDLDPSQTLTITSVDIGGEIPDCNGNNQPDFCDLLNGTSFDCNSDGVPDECQADCNGNGLHDDCDIAEGTSLDCNGNGVPDECEPDCDGNGVPDDCELEGNDCNANGVLDVCDIAGGASLDCNGDGVPDDCQLEGNDCDGDGVPDDCQLEGGDCNANGVLDRCDIAGGSSLDENQNGVPDECEETVGAVDRPSGFDLAPAHPNPFNPSTVVSFTLPETGAVSLRVFDIGGREVARLLDGLAPAGETELRFEAGDLASGLYLLVLEAPQGRLVQRMLLVR